MALASLVLQFLALRAEFGYGVLQSIWVMARYLTILTTVLVAATFGALATGLRPVGPRWLAALTLAILLVAVGFTCSCAGSIRPRGWRSGPISAFTPWGPPWWRSIGSSLRRAGHWSLGDLPLFLTWPAIYVSYALTRGGLDGRFPYPFLDPSAIGWTPVLWTVASFTLGIIVAGAVMIFLDRVLERVIS